MNYQHMETLASSAIGPNIWCYSSGLIPALIFGDNYVNNGLTYHLSLLERVGVGAGFAFLINGGRSILGSSPTTSQDIALVGGIVSGLYLRNLVSRFLPKKNELPVDTRM